MTRLLSTWRGWLFAIFAAAFLTACDPIADIVAQSEAEVGTPVAFRASLLAQYRDAPPTDLQYHWNFGDGSSAEGPTATHVYTQEGTYEVVLEATDDAARRFGMAYVTRSTVVVRAFTGALVPVSVRVYDENGASLSGASVTVAGQTAETNESGGALLLPSQPELSPVVIIRKPGYITQVLRVPPGNATERGVMTSLKREAEAQSIDQVEQPQVLEGTGSLMPRVSVPESAFVNGRGEPVAGAATVRISQWDVTKASDMRAFPGEAQADDGKGAVVRLVSFGMLNIEFTQNGEKLQLAAGKVAEISMDLPITQEVDGREIHIGDKIPLWHFDEARGLWVQEGEGDVVASETSSTGMGVHARVGHFSSWNWDKLLPPEAVTVSRKVVCVIPDGNGGFKPLEAGNLCSLSLEQTLANGEVLTWSLTVPPEGASYPRFIEGASVTTLAEDLLEGHRGTGAWQASASDASTTWVIELPQQEIKAVDDGDVPVVEDVGEVEFLVPIAGMDMEFRGSDMKIFRKSAADGTLTEVPFAVHLSQMLDRSRSDVPPNMLPLDFRVHGGGSANVGDGRGNLSGDFVVKLPVDSNFSINADGERVPGQTVVYEAELSIPVQTYHGPTLLKVSGSSEVYALWDEVGVSSPINENSLVEMRYVAMDGGWASTPTPWVPASAPNFELPKGQKANQLPPNYFRPYFALNLDCARMGDYLFGPHRVQVHVRVTDPVSGQNKVYKSKVFANKFLDVGACI